MVQHLEIKIGFWFCAESVVLNFERNFERSFWIRLKDIMGKVEIRKHIMGEDLTGSIFQGHASGKGQNKRFEIVKMFNKSNVAIFEFSWIAGNGFPCLISSL